MKELKLINMKISEILPYKRNAKKHPPEQIQQIKASIQEFGFIQPVLIDKKNNLICGHGRVSAAKQLGMTEVPCLLVEHLSEAQRRAFVHVENRLQESGGAEWDKDILKLELEDLTLNLDFDLGPIGFSSEEIESLLRENEPLPFAPNLSDDDDTPSVLTHKLVVECDDEDLKQDLFDELKSRGFKVKAG
jgi:ParB-like chromosome segregation protein Spo0J